MGPISTGVRLLSTSRASVSAVDRRAVASAVAAVVAAAAAAAVAAVAVTAAAAVAAAAAAAVAAVAVVIATAIATATAGRSQALIWVIPAGQAGGDHVHLIPTGGLAGSTRALGRSPARSSACINR